MKTRFVSNLTSQSCILPVENKKSSFPLTITNHVEQTIGRDPINSTKALRQGGGDKSKQPKKTRVKVNPGTVIKFFSSKLNWEPKILSKTTEELPFSTFGRHSNKLIPSTLSSIGDSYVEANIWFWDSQRRSPMVNLSKCDNCNIKIANWW